MLNIVDIIAIIVVVVVRGTKSSIISIARVISDVVNGHAESVNSIFVNFVTILLFAVR